MPTLSSHAGAYVRRDRPLDGLHVTALPVDGLDDLGPFGVVIGRRVHQARRFRHVILPPGWVGRGDRWGLWTHLVDQYGRTRAMVHWDPGCGEGHTTAMNIWYYVVRVGNPGTAEPLALDHQWATRDALLTAVGRRRDDLLFGARYWQQQLDTRGDRYLGNRLTPNTVSGSRDDDLAVAARYETLLQTLQAAPDRPGPVPGWPPVDTTSPSQALPA